LGPLEKFMGLNLVNFADEGHALDGGGVPPLAKAIFEADGFPLVGQRQKEVVVVRFLFEIVALMVQIAAEGAQHLQNGIVFILWLTRDLLSFPPGDLKFPLVYHIEVV
jgi:hypothetical protein